MKLYYKPGACSMAAHIVLIELGIPFSLERTDTSRGITESGQNYADINPNGYVPALELAPGVVLTENPAILEYLADLDPAQRLAPPHNTLERTRLRELLAFLSSELHKTFSPFFSGIELPPAERHAAQTRMARRLAALEARLNGAVPWLMGAQLTVADFYAFVILNWAGFIGISLQTWPATEAFRARLSTHPSVLQALKTEGLLPAESPR